jgi:hypothetical protein
MRYYFAIILLLALSLEGVGQISSFSFSAGAGYTIVNIEKAIDYADLEDWDNIGAMIKVSADYEIKEKLMLVGEIGTNRLYYWEYYWNDGYYSGYRYRAEWTTNFGIHLKKYFNEKGFLQIGPGLHIFNDGSGVVPGLVFQLGYEIPIAGNIFLPVLFRVESVFGSSLPTSALVGAGITYRLGK